MQMFVFTAMLAVSSNPAAMTAAGAASPGVSPGEAPLDKTWTTRGHRDQMGSQVAEISALTSPGSFSAEGKGVEPSTACAAPDFESGC